MELIVVIVLLGVMTGIAIPRYSATLEKSYSQDAVMQLTAIHAANQIMFARTGAYWPPVNPRVDYSLAEINAALNLNIIANGMVYICPNSNVGGFSCTATRSAPATQFVVQVTEVPISSANPACVVGSGCP